MNIDNHCYFTISEGTLTVGNTLFSRSFLGICEANAEYITPNSRALPYLEVTAKKEDGSACRYQLWEALPVVRIVEGATDPLLVLEGEHWMLKSIKLNAFTDNRDTLVEENEHNFFRKGLFAPVEGEIFFLEERRPVHSPQSNARAFPHSPSYE